MKRKFLKSLIFVLFFMLISITKSYAMPANSNFSDDVFYKAIIENLNKYEYNGISDRDEDYLVTDEELESIEYLSIGSLDLADKERVYNLDGLEYLTSLKSLIINYPEIDKIDISQNIELTNLNILNANNLKSIDFSNNINLETIDLTYVHLEELELSNCTKLKFLEMGAGSIDNSTIRKLDLSNCEELEYLGISGNKLESIDLSQNKKLETVRITNGTLKSIILPEYSRIETLALFENEIERIEDIENFETSYRLNSLYLQYNYIEDFSLVKNKNIDIEKLYPQNNNETEYLDETYDEEYYKDYYGYIDEDSYLEDNETFYNEDYFYDSSSGKELNIAEIFSTIITIISLIPVFIIIYGIIKSLPKSKKKYDELGGDGDEDLSGGPEDKRL